MSVARKLVVCAFVVIGAAVASTGTASASVTVPFQVAPAAFGNPNGSFDLPAFRCAAVVGEQPGAVTIAGGDEGRWGCLVSSDVRWLNLSTGATGYARMSDGLNGIPGQVTLHTGIGQVVVTVLGSGGTITPGVASFFVP
ncbi:hypothetical protein [Rhodococcus sovatensis]|uniref:Secreted protein n=1 Tax=Rhodococcus sovatensis TaxID=1805840 RepID=A0ABZ2PMZ4_9NOCA